MDKTDTQAPPLKQSQVPLENAAVPEPSTPQKVAPRQKVTEESDDDDEDILKGKSEIALQEVMDRKRKLLDTQKQQDESCPESVEQFKPKSTAIESLPKASAVKVSLPPKSKPAGPKRKIIKASSATGNDSLVTESLVIPNPKKSKTETLVTENNTVEDKEKPNPLKPVLARGRRKAASKAMEVTQKMITILPSLEREPDAISMDQTVSTQVAPIPKKSDEEIANETSKASVKKGRAIVKKKPVSEVPLDQAITERSNDKLIKHSDTNDLASELPKTAKKSVAPRRKSVSFTEADAVPGSSKELEPVETAADHIASSKPKKTLTYKKRAVPKIKTDEALPMPVAAADIQDKENVSVSPVKKQKTEMSEKSKIMTGQVSSDAIQFDPNGARRRKTAFKIMFTGVDDESVKNLVNL